MECTAAFENLENKNKKLKLNPNAPLSTLPCKIAHTCNTNENEVIHKFKHSKTTAILVQPASKTAHLRGAPQVLPTWRGLLDSGSTGDLLFIKKGANNENLYDVHATPQAWHISSGIYHTYKCAELEIIFPEYSHSKRVTIRPDIIEYENDENAPPFDLIIGKNTLDALKVHLDWENKMITIDETKLPMQNIHNLQTSKSRLQL